ncbi:MAG: diapophytoene dehydrogenase [Flavobacteriaceae bacterium]|nr:diapophytoene dehydrogenase [Flavobacteriaceae bacterium]|tara:strand:- start:11280 stop:12566 length:1287 start_codon:yes stop_codon:yes gene_type:complete
MAEYKLLLPAMGESVDEATVTQWLKNEGDIIEADDAVVEIATDKVDSEVPSEISGKLLKKLVEENQVVRVGEPLAIIETSQELPEVEEPEESPTEIPEPTEVKADFLESKAKEILAPPTPAVPTTSGDTYFSPLVKSIAKKEGLTEAELQQIPGTGKNGRVTKKDILQFLQSRSLQPNVNLASSPITTAPKPESVGTRALSRMEQLIADHMHKSLQTSAHVQSFIEVDVTELWDWREGIKQSFFQREGEKITFTPIFMMLTAQVLRDFPLLNSSLEGNQIIHKRNINLGMATALSDGNLIVPVIKNADQLSLVGFTKKVNDLAKRAREGVLQPDDVKDGTYTVTNVGMFDSLMGTPIINQPQLGILALGAIRKVPAVVETDKGDFVGIRRKMILSHSYDHRVINGAMGGLFIKALKQRIENWDSSQQL